MSAWGYYNEAVALPDIGSPYEGELWEGKHKQWDPTRLCSEHLCPKHVGLGLEIHTMELCGSDE